MRFPVLLLLVIALFFLSGCEAKRSDDRAEQSLASQKQSAAVRESFQDSKVPNQPGVSLEQANSANTASQAIDRKIIRNANLSLEVASPTDSQTKIFSLAESHGGFVVTSEMTQQTSSGDKTKPELSVNLVVRVPASQFDQAMEAIRAIGTRVVQEKRTGQDVTEEFIDLEARIKNQKALEIQFLEIMKRAGKVEEALAVQRELASVRTEIEKLEGRKRFLENQASLSTINVTLQTPTQIVNAVGFWYNVKTAFADGLDVAAAIVLFLIRAIIALIPVLVFLALPIALIAKLVVARLRRRRARAKVVENVEAA